MLYCGTL